MARTPPRRGLNCRLKNVTVGNTGRRENVIFTGYTSRRATHDHLMGRSMQSIPCALVISDTPPRVLSRVSILVRESNLKKKEKREKKEENKTRFDGFAKIINSREVSTSLPPYRRALRF